MAIPAENGCGDYYGTFGGGFPPKPVSTLDLLAKRRRGHGSCGFSGGSEAALEVPGIDGLEITIPVSHKVVPLPEGNRYLGFLFARAATPEQVETALRAAYAKLDVKIEPS